MKPIPVGAAVITLALVTGIAALAQPTMSVTSIPPKTPAAVKAAIKRLYSEDPIKRAYAALDLGKMGSSAVSSAPFLSSMLGDGDALVWMPDGRRTSPADEAGNALVKMGKPAVEYIIRSLKNGNSGARQESAELLGRLKDARAIDPLIQTLDDQDDDVARASAEALALYSDPRIVRTLVGMLGREHSYMPDVAERILVDIGKSAVPELLMALQSENAVVRMHAAKALGLIKDQRAMEMLLTRLKDPDAVVVCDSAEALGGFSDPRVVEALILVLKTTRDTDEHTIVARIGASKASANLKDKRAVEPLIATLEYANEARKRGAYGWGIPGSDILAEESARALRETTGQAFGQDAGKWREWWSRQ